MQEKRCITKCYCKGISLLETLISLGLFSILLLAISQLISYNQQRLNLLSARLELQLTLHQIAELIAKDLKRIGFGLPPNDHHLTLDLEKTTTSKQYQCILFNYQFDKPLERFGYRFENKNIRTFDSRQNVSPMCKQQSLNWKRLLDDNRYQITEFTLEQLKGKANTKAIKLKLAGQLKQKQKKQIGYQLEMIIPLLNQ